MRAFKRYRARYQRLVDENLIGVAIGLLDGTLEQVNDAFLTMLGNTRADLRAGKVQWKRMTPPEWVHVDEAALARLRATGTTGTFEKEYARKDGSRVPVLIGAAFLDGEEFRQNDESDRIVYFALDISAQKRAEADLVRLNASLENQITERTAELEAANRELRDHELRLERALGEAENALRARAVFVAVASHELKTPLTPLRLSLQALRGDLARVSPADHWLPRLDLLLRQVDRLTSLVDAILDVAQSASAPMATRFEDTDLTELTREVLARFAAAAANARCPTVLHAAGAAVAEVDPTRIEQVVANLLANAIRFGAGKPITLSVIPGPASVRLLVEDNGVGIAEEDQSRIFDLFERAVDERRYGGLGLGLYIARNIVEAHDGTITCSSTPGSGARFEIELPRKRPPKSAPPLT